MKYFYSEKFGCSFFENKKTRVEVRENITNYSEMKKSPFSINTMDHSDTQGISIYYNKSNNINEIELFGPNGGFYLNGQNIIDNKLSFLKQILFDLEKKIIMNDDLDTIFIDDGRVRFYIPDFDCKGDNALVESVVISYEEFT